MIVNVSAMICLDSDISPCQLLYIVTYFKINDRYHFPSNLFSEQARTQTKLIIKEIDSKNLSIVFTFKLCHLKEFDGCITLHNLIISMLLTFVAARRNVANPVQR